MKNNASSLPKWGAYLLGLLLVVAVGALAYYKKEKSKFGKDIEQYVQAPDLKILEQLYQNKIPTHQKQEMLKISQQKYNCQMAYLVAAIATTKQKKIITTADLNNCYQNYYSEKEAGQLASAIRKMSEEANEASETEEALLKKATAQSKLIENLVSINSFFKQKEMDIESYRQLEGKIPKDTLEKMSVAERLKLVAPPVPAPAPTPTGAVDAKNNDDEVVDIDKKRADKRNNKEEVKK